MLVMNKWDQRFFSLAEEVATWSKDPACKVGAVLVDPEHREFAFGYNGFPAGVADSIPRLGDRAKKNMLMVHAEVNAILNARRDLTGWKMYCTKPPCMDCATAIIQSGVSTLCIPSVVPTSSWYIKNEHALSVLLEAEIDVLIDCDGVLIEAR